MNGRYSCDFPKGRTPNLLFHEELRLAKPNADSSIELFSNPNAKTSDDLNFKPATESVSDLDWEIVAPPTRTERILTRVADLAYWYIFGE